MQTKFFEEGFGVKRRKEVGLFVKEVWVSKIDEIGGLGSKRERKSRALNKDFRIFWIGIVNSSKEERRLKNSRNLGSSMEDLGLRGERKLGFMQTKLVLLRLKKWVVWNWKGITKFSELNQNSGVFGAVGSRAEVSKGGGEGVMPQDLSHWVKGYDRSFMSQILVVGALHIGKKKQQY